MVKILVITSYKEATAQGCGASVQTIVVEADNEVKAAKMMENINKASVQVSVDIEAIYLG